jgi:hypothetical protein
MMDHGPEPEELDRFNLLLPLPYRVAVILVAGKFLAVSNESVRVIASS